MVPNRRTVQAIEAARRGDLVELRIPHRPSQNSITTAETCGDRDRNRHQTVKQVVRKAQFRRDFKRVKHRKRGLDLLELVRIGSHTQLGP